MPSFPPPGSVSICEINRHLSKILQLSNFMFWCFLTQISFVFACIRFTVTADSISDEGAKESYGKILVISSIRWILVFWIVLLLLVGFCDESMFWTLIFAFVYQGTVFGPVPFKAENLLSASNGDGDQLSGNRESGLTERGISTFPSKIFAAVNRFFHPNDVSS